VGSDFGDRLDRHTLAMTHRWTVDYAGSADYRFSDELNSTLSAGVQLNARKRRVFSVSGQGLVANNLNLISAAASRNAGEGLTEQTSLGFFVEERLGWRDRVYATGPPCVSTTTRRSDRNFRWCTTRRPRCRG
jgi:hypothetical protein